MEENMNHMWKNVHTSKEFNENRKIQKIKIKYENDTMENITIR